MYLHVYEYLFPIVRQVLYHLIHSTSSFLILLGMYPGVELPGDMIILLGKCSTIELYPQP
jgi:hypothetical protein